MRLAVEAQDSAGVVALLAPDVILRSPITTRIRFEGVEQVGQVLEQVFKLLSDVKFYETIGEGTPNQVIFWRGRLGRHYLEEANLLRLDGQGRIREMTVFMRPLPGLLTFTATLAPSLARRRGWIRAAIIWPALAGIAAVYRLGEPLAAFLMGAGVPTSGEET